MRLEECETGIIWGMKVVNSAFILEELPLIETQPSAADPAIGIDSVGSGSSRMKVYIPLDFW